MDSNPCYADKGTYIYKQKKGPAIGRKINLTEPCNKTSKDFIENPGRKIELEVKQAWDLMVTKGSQQNCSWPVSPHKEKDSCESVNQILISSKDSSGHRDPKRFGQPVIRSRRTSIYAKHNSLQFKTSGKEQNL